MAVASQRTPDRKGQEFMAELRRVIGDQSTDLETLRAIRARLAEVNSMKGGPPPPTR